LIALGFFLLQLYREHRWTLESMATVYRVVLYASLGLAFLTFDKWRRGDSNPGPRQDRPQRLRACSTD